MEDAITIEEFKEAFKESMAENKKSIAKIERNSRKIERIVNSILHK
ncbi:MAG: hypothetical protein ABIB71_08405 [Candidatus Woesearchaeota archaeon]